jgi:hypothetical protein
MNSKLFFSAIMASLVLIIGGCATSGGPAKEAPAAKPSLHRNIPASLRRVFRLAAGQG